MRREVLSPTVGSRRMVLAVLAAFLAAVGTLSVLSAHPAGSQTTGASVDYIVEDIGSLGSGPSVASGINNSGQVVGGSSSHAFLYDKTDGIQDLGTPPETISSHAHAINDSGQVVGEARPSCDGCGDFSRAVLYENSAWSDLGTFGGSVGVAFDINNFGQVAGYADYSTRDRHAFLYDKTNGLQDLGTLGGGTSLARGINNSGQVVGNSNPSNSPYSHAFLYPDPQNSGQMKDLGTLGGGFTSVAESINDSGRVVGITETAPRDDPNSASHAFLYDETNGMQDLGTLEGDSSSWAQAINNSGQVVGVSYSVSLQRPFLYRDGKMVDLNSLIPADSGWVLKDATDINDKGQIVGWGYPKGQEWIGHERALLLNPDLRPWVESVGPTGSSEPRNTNVTITFSEPMNEGTLKTSGTRRIKDSTIYLFREGSPNRAVPARLSISKDGQGRTVVTLNPKNDLRADSLYVVVVKGGPAGVLDATGKQLDDDHEREPDANFDFHETFGTG